MSQTPQKELYLVVSRNVEPLQAEAVLLSEALDIKYQEWQAQTHKSNNITAGGTSS